MINNVCHYHLLYIEKLLNDLDLHTPDSRHGPNIDVDIQVIKTVKECAL